MSKKKKKLIKKPAKKAKKPAKKPVKKAKPAPKKMKAPKPAKPVKAAPKVKAKPLSAKAAAIKDKIDHLVTKGKKRGFITYDEILKNFPNIETDVILLDDLYAQFMESSIDVIEGG